MNMYLHRSDLTRISEILNKFPYLDRFELVADSSSGIGTILQLNFQTEVNGIQGQFSIEITGHKDW